MLNSRCENDYIESRARCQRFESILRYFVERYPAAPQASLRPLAFPPPPLVYRTAQKPLMRAPARKRYIYRPHPFCPPQRGLARVRTLTKRSCRGICTHRDAIFRGRTHSSAFGAPIGGRGKLIHFLLARHIWDIAFVKLLPRKSVGAPRCANAYAGSLAAVRTARASLPSAAPIRQPVRTMCVLYLLPRCVKLETDITRR